MAKREIEVEVADLAEGEVWYCPLPQVDWDRARVLARQRGIEEPDIIRLALKTWTKTRTVPAESGRVYVRRLDYRFRRFRIGRRIQARRKHEPKRK